MVAFALITNIASSAALQTAPKKDDLPVFLEKLSRIQSSTQTLKAAWTQKKKITLFKTEVTTHGMMYFKKPHFIRWESLPPDASIFLMRASRAELRLPGHSPQVLNLANPSAKANFVDQLLCWIGVAPMKANISKYYRASVHNISKNETRLHLVPHDSALSRRIIRVELTFNSHLLLQKVHILQPDQESTEITFSQIERNVALKNTLFQ